jgi:hypothetical protein
MATLAKAKEVFAKLGRVLPEEDFSPRMVWDLLCWIDRRGDGGRGRHLRTLPRQVIDDLTFEDDQDWIEACQRLKSIIGVYR